jgi:hypothetical protein
MVFNSFLVLGSIIASGLTTTSSSITFILTLPNLLMLAVTVGSLNLSFNIYASAILTWFDVDVGELLAFNDGIISFISLFSMVLFFIL